jgi:hypothetical protein
MKAKEVFLGEQKIIYDFMFQIQDDIKCVRKIIQNLDQPFIFNAGTLENHFFNISPSLDSIDVYRALVFELRKMTGLDNIWEIAEEICEEDVEWGEWRNRELTGKYYYKFTVKPYYQEKIIVFLTDWLEKLETLLKEAEEEENKEKLTKLERNNRFSVVYTHKLINPRGGEDDVDGYADLEIKSNITGNVVRMVARNVFDFGYYVYPKRVEGTEDVFNKDVWTEEEKQAAEWLREFPPFYSGLRI